MGTSAEALISKVLTPIWNDIALQTKYGDDPPVYLFELVELLAKRAIGVEETGEGVTIILPFPKRGD